jgi:glycosyltransferase involved in cell wall biosynthesis
MIESGVTGTLVSPGRVPDMTAAIRALVIGPDLRRRMGQAARSIATSVFSAEKMVRNYETLYDEVLAN